MLDHFIWYSRASDYVFIAESKAVDQGHIGSEVWENVHLVEVHFTFCRIGSILSLLCHLRVKMKRSVRLLIPYVSYGQFIRKYT